MNDGGMIYFLHRRDFILQVAQLIGAELFFVDNFCRVGMSTGVVDYSMDSCCSADAELLLNGVALVEGEIGSGGALHVGQ